MDENILQYREMISECDAVSQRLSNMHIEHLVCRRGCCSCCVNLTVFPVEFYSILDAINRDNLKLRFDETASCGFLNKEGGCSIYKYRPLICRTHGLPIAFKDEQAGEMVNNVSFCGLNFTHTDAEYEFDKFNTLNVDSLNNKFFSINIEFISKNPEMDFEITSRIELKRLLDFCR